MIMKHSISCQKSAKRLKVLVKPNLTFIRENLSYVIRYPEFANRFKSRNLGRLLRVGDLSVRQMNYYLKSYRNSLSSFAIPF